jgi:hypothetical protein
MHTCAALHASAEKRRELERRHDLVVEWAKRHGPGWDDEVPDEVFVRVPPAAVALVPRARESKPRRGAATSRGGDSGDSSDEADPPDVARDERASRREKARR